MIDEKKVREAIAKEKEAIGRITALIELIPTIDTRAIEFLETAIEALEKQLPKKAIASHNENFYNVQYRCPVCDNLVLTEDVITLLFGTDIQHCDKCGQRLDWSE